MFKRIRKPVTTKQILSFVFLLNSMKRFLAALGILGMLWSYVPWQHINANSKTFPEEVFLEILNNKYDEEYLLGSDANFNPSEIPIVSEVLEERTETTKTFRKIDGTYEVNLYDSSIHYEVDGQWKDINNSIFDNGTEFENISNKFKLKFPKMLDDNKKIKLTMDKYSIDWSVLNINKSEAEYDNQELTLKNIRELSGINSSVLYKNIQSNVDIEYILSGSKIKENIILNKYIPNFDMSFEYKLKNLIIIENEEGNIVFINEFNEVVFLLSDLYMIDESGDISYNIGLTYELTSNNTYEIKITPDDLWMQNAEYPVVIDPTINSQSTSISIYDTYISENASGINFYDQTFMPVSNNVPGADYHAMLYFILPSTVMDKVITYSYLELTKSSGFNGRQINLHKNTQIFSSNTVTWNSWYADGIQRYEDRVIDYHVVDLDSIYTFDITKAVKEWQATGSTRTTGFTIKDPHPYDAYNSVKQNHTNNDASIRPTIIIGYEDTSGINDYWTYQTQSAGLAGTGYVTDYTGSLTFIRNDFSHSSERFSLALSFIYNLENRNVDIGYGNGWRSNYDVEMGYDSFSSQYYTIDGDGSKVYFASISCSDTRLDWISQSGSSCYVSEDGTGNILYYYLNDFYLETKSGMKYAFGDNDKLTYIESLKTGEQITFEYRATLNTRIEKITDSVGNYIDFRYCTDDRMCIMEAYLKTGISTYEMLEQKFYYVDSNNDMYKVISKYDYNKLDSAETGNNIYYTYDSHKLETTYVDGYSTDFTLEYGYSINNKVNNIKTYTGSKNTSNINILHEFQKTTYTDHNNNQVTYRFDYFGHTINVVDTHGNAIFQTYSNPFIKTSDISDPFNEYSEITENPDFFNNHKLLDKSVPEKVILNPLENFSFEMEENWDGSWNSLWNDNIGWNIDSFSSYAGDAGRDSVYTLGNKGAFITKNQGYETSNPSIYQTIILDEGEYVLRGFIKNENDISIYGGADIFATGTGVSTVYYSGTQYLTDGWSEYERVFTVANDNTTVTIKMFNASVGTAYYDNIQLQEGFRDTKINYLENSSFEKNTYGWTTSGASRVATDETGIFKDVIGEYTMEINGTPDYERYLKQNDLLYAYANGVLVVGGWAKADAVPNKVTSDGRKFGIEVEISRYDQAWNIDLPHKTYYLPFDTDIDDWQFMLRSIDITELQYDLSIIIDEIIVKFVYQGEGTAYFDSAQLYIEDNSTRYTYNSIGNLIAIDSASSGGVTTIEYDPVNPSDIEKITDADGRVTDFNDTNSDRLIDEIITSNNVKASLKYNSYGNVYETTFGETITDGEFFESYTVYQDFDQYHYYTRNEFGKYTYTMIDIATSLLTSSRTANGDDSVYNYDNYGRLTEVVSYDGIAGSTTPEVVSSQSYEYDVEDRLWKIIVDDITYELLYDEIGNVSVIKVANSTIMSYDYVEEDVDEDQITDYYTHNLEKQTYGNGDYIEFDYDNEGRIIDIKFNGTSRFQYEYNSYGDLVVYNDLYNNNIYYYTYGSVGRLEKIIDKDGNSIIYDYDNAGNIDSVNYTIDGINSNHTMSYNLNTGMYEESLHNTPGESYITYLDYKLDDSLNRVDIQRLVINSNTLISSQYNYDDSSVISTYGNATTRILENILLYGVFRSDYEYEYDNNGNITSIIDTYNNDDERHYHYDALNQLVREDLKYTGTWGTVSETYVYNYDDYGNVLSKKIYYYTSPTSTPTALKETINYTYKSTGWTDQLEQIGDLQLSYDNQGNITSQVDSISGASVEYTWDGRQLTGYYTLEGYISYKYDDQGTRTSKTSYGVTTNYYLEGSKVIYQENGTYSLFFTYDVDGSLLSFTYDPDIDGPSAGVEYYYLKNVQGDIIGILNGNGTKLVTYVYDAWGNIKLTRDTSGINLAEINPYRYRGYRFDEDTGLYYLQSRYYNPNWGRFISSDGLLGGQGDILGHNMYAYAQNNPIRFIDPDGESIILAIIIVGAIIGATAGGVIVHDIAKDNGAEGAELIAWTAAGVVGGGILGGAAGYFAAPAVSTFLGSSFTFTLGSGMSLSGGSAALTATAVTITGTQIAVAGGLTVATGLMLASTGNRNGYRAYKYPNDHAPDHVHLKGQNGSNVRIGRDGNPLRGEPKLNPQQNRALKQLWDEIQKLFNVFN